MRPSALVSWRGAGLQFAGSHLLPSLLAFNVGIELGQVGALAVMLPALALLRRHLLVGRAGMIVLSVLVAHVSWHWMTDRLDVLGKVEFPQPDASGLWTAATWLAGFLLTATLLQLVSGRLLGSRRPAPASLAR